ncbi:MAG: hypothetical protein QXN24_08220 [Candidatus Bathyarchaeia archaeon]
MVNSNFEEALLNIEAFCRVLADKISGKESCSEPDPIEKLLKRKATFEFYGRSVEGRESLIDFFEDEKEIKILALVNPLSKSEIALNSDTDFTEITIGDHLKIKLPFTIAESGKVHVKNFGWTFEITVEKAIP